VLKRLMPRVFIDNSQGLSLINFVQITARLEKSRFFSQKKTAVAGFVEARD